MQRILLAEELRRLTKDGEASIPPAPEPENLATMSPKLGTDFYQTLALILKGHWEQHLSENISVSWDAAEKNRPECIDTDACKASFQPDSNRIYDAMETRAEWSGMDGYSREAFEELVREMILADIHQVGIDSLEFKAFAARETENHALQSSLSKEEEQDLRILKSYWLQNQNIIGDLLLAREQVRLKNAHIRWQFLKRFGATYLDLKTTAARHDRLRLKLDLLEAMPMLTDEELERMSGDTAEETARRLALLRLDVLLAPSLAKPLGSNTACVVTGLGRLRRESKRILREIWMLIHPDRLERHGCCHLLTVAQREKLNTLWMQVMEVRPEEVGFMEEQLGFQYRPLMVLENILSDVRAVLRNAGIDTDTRMIIEGATLEEQQQWLKNAINRQDLEIDAIRAEIKTLMENRETGHQSAMMSADPGTQENAEKDMIERTGRLQAEADALEASLENLRRGPTEGK